MRVQRPRMGIRRTLYGQTTRTGADRAQAPPGGRKPSRWGYGPGGGQGTRHKRSYLPSLEKPLRRDEHQRSEAPQRAGEGERPPQEASRREGAGHRHPQGGEPGKLLSPTRRRAAVEHVRRRLGVSERRACGVASLDRASATLAARRKGTADWPNGWSSSRGRIRATVTGGVGGSRGAGVLVDVRAV